MLHRLLPSLQCFDAVGWVARRASGLQKTEWWDAGVVMCLGHGAGLLLNVAAHHATENN